MKGFRRYGVAAASAATMLASLAAGCGGSSGGDQTQAAGQSGTSTFPQSSEPANLTPADFTTQIDNPYLPMRPGSRWVVRVTNDQGEVQSDVITVSDQTKRMADGVRARVVHDVVSEHGNPAEVTDDYYAQDSDGNVWYFGENTAEFHNGRKDTSGSFEAGVNGADAGIAMLAHPEVGQTYREEYYAGQAEDRSKVLSLDEQAQVPFGHFTNALLTKDYSPLEPNVLEYKLYAQGVGQVLAVTVSGGSEREELVSYTH